MNKLKFQHDQGVAFNHTLHRRIREYFEQSGRARTGNQRMVFKIALYFALDVLFYLLMIQASNLVLFYLYYLFMGFFVLLTAFNVSHDAAHGVAVKSKRWNDWLFKLSFNLQGNNAYVWGKYHNESHHAYTNVEGSDIDVLNNPLLRMTASQRLRWFHRYQHWYAPVLYLFYSLNWFLFRETLMVLGISSRTIQIKLPAIEVFKLFFYKLVYIGFMIIAPAMLLPFGWQPVVLAFLLNHVMVSLIFTAVLGVSHLSDRVQHPEPNQAGEVSMSWPMLQMVTSLDYNSGSRLLNWTLGGFNAHTLHHLLPNICHIHYLEILPIFREVAEEHGIEYMEVSYGQALRSHFKFLKKMGHATNC